METSSRKIFGNYILSVVNSLLSVVLPVITFPYVSRILGSSNLGIINFAQSYGYYFIHIANFGISSYAVREISRVRNDKEALEKKANEIFNLNFFFSVISWTLYCIGVITVPRLRENLVVLLIYSLIIISNFLTVEWLLQSFDDYLFSTVRSTIVRILSLVAVFVFVKHENDYAIYMLITTISEMGARLSAVKYSRSRYVKLKIKRVYLNFKAHFKSMFTLFSFRLVNGISAQLDKLMIGFMMLYSDVGVYSAGVKIPLLIAPVIENIGMVLFPTLTIAAKDSIEKYKEGVKLNYNLILMTAIPMFVGLFLTSPMIIKIFAGEQYLESITISRIMALTVLLCPIGDMLGSKTLLIFNKSDNLLVSSVIVAISNIVLNSIFIPIAGIVGAAIASVISYLIAIGCRLFFTKKIFDFKIFTFPVCKYTLFTLPFCVIYYIFRSEIDTKIWAFLGFVCLCVVIYLVELIAFKDNTFFVIKNLIINKKGIKNEEN